jgi:tetratricopeptide (TPR) repeat protein
MSPEQALAKREVVDYRTDLYSLGATLYELLTLEPAFGGTDRQELLRQIAFEEPKPPRRLNRAVPADLETIVRHALEKNPADRFGTAQELADDLRLFLEDRPIRSRRPTVVHRACKWSRRHKPVVVALATGFVSVLVLAVVLAFWYQRRLAETDRGVTAALTQAETLLEEADKQTDHPERWLATARLALAAQEKAEELLASGVAREHLAARVQQVRMAVDVAVADSELQVELDRIWLEQAATNVKENYFDEARAAPLYAKALAKYGIDPAAPEAAAERVRDSRLREALLSALWDWSWYIRDRGESQRVVRVFDLAVPPHSLWAKLTRAQDNTEFVKLVQEPSMKDLPSRTIVLTARKLESMKAWGVAEQLLRGGLERHPGDFGLNHNLGMVLAEQQPPRGVEAVRYLTAAMALRPDSPGVHLNLGNALRRNKDLDGAIRHFRAALLIDSNYAAARYSLGVALDEKGQLDEAIAEHREALRLEPDFPLTRINLGNSLRKKGQLDQAIAEIREAIRISPNLAVAHYTLGGALKEKGQLDEAIAECREALRIKPDFPEAHYNLGGALKAKGRLDEAIAELREAIRIKPEFPEAHTNLGGALKEKGQLDEAIAECRDALRIKPDFPMAHYNLGGALEAKGRLDEAVAEYCEAIKLRPDFPEAHTNLGGALAHKGQLDEAVAEYRLAIASKRNFPEAYLAHAGLAHALQTQGQLEGAIAEYREAIRLKQDFAEAHCNLGLVLIRLGQFREAIEELRRGHELGSRNPRWANPSAQWLRDAERLADLDARLPALLQDREQPKDADERLVLAQLCRFSKRLFAAAARWYSEAFAAQPGLADNLSAGHRYNAACAAALAGCAQGQDAGGLGDPERADLRNQAVNWLRADLGTWRRVHEKGPEANRSAVVQKLAHWLEDPDLAGVRGPEALARLPEGERAAWQKLWADVEEMLAKIRREDSPRDQPAR